MLRVREHGSKVGKLPQGKREAREHSSVLLLQGGGTYQATLSKVAAVDKKEEEKGSALEQEAKNQAKRDLDDIGTAVIPTKLEEPGSFNLPCSINYMHFNKCLYDLGASVSVMHYSITEKLGYEEFRPSNLYISLADGSNKDVIVKLENFPMKIRKPIIPTDFVIIEMEKENEDPIILGRPFLATAGAIIDVKRV
ncbi:PREDICTED: uncharacterized protein LOC109126859 [Camelina sativa]|uniref:Uncharacterized protein LOC109126859 n=1 Tax=Camelina sativa TaxID=90675 RepID=A0ABM1QHQ2_CAMSA|nr:PREDICTED: uncharacterized protein LOC109126859 [Camelina sativa]